MSQPTRARTTAAGRSTRKTTGKAAERHDDPALAQPPSSGLAPETLARTLRAVAAELERDPALARRVADAIAAPASVEPEGKEREGGEHERPAARGVNQSFRPRLVTGADPALGSGIPDPYAIYGRGREKGLRTALAELRLGSLRAIVREHRLDPSAKLTRQNDAEKLRAAIVAAAKRGK